MSSVSDRPGRERDLEQAVVRTVVGVLADAGVEAVVRLLWPPEPHSEKAEDVVLYQGGRVDVCVRRHPGAGVDGYVYTRWYGDRPIVAVLPFRGLPVGGWEVLLTDEVVPAWHGQGLSAITGTPESADPVDDAVRELAEETGYEVAADELISLGHVYASKGSSSRYVMYAVDVTECEPGVATGDGSPIESAATPVWVHVDAVWKVRHSVVHTMVDRLARRMASDLP
ncbi:NUDIX domain-containing protein [Micromonospora sp. CPCC 206061]|uniref:NUDIX domain-containing protein n=1 Tax=Micromonospora sp. CPCC 206061 TaxID=3122410 RepID=UPI002FEF05ED